MAIDEHFKNRVFGARVNPQQLAAGTFYIRLQVLVLQPIARKYRSCREMLSYTVK